MRLGGTLGAWCGGAYISHLFYCFDPRLSRQSVIDICQNAFFMFQVSNRIVQSAPLRLGLYASRPPAEGQDATANLAPVSQISVVPKGRLIQVQDAGADIPADAPLRPMPEVQLAAWDQLAFHACFPLSPGVYIKHLETFDVRTEWTSEFYFDGDFQPELMVVLSGQVLERRENHPIGLPREFEGTGVMYEEPPVATDAPLAPESDNGFARNGEREPPF
jgi:hypothetical protein